METPPQEHGGIRRSTRSALVEIPARMGALTVNENRSNVRLNGTGGLTSRLLTDVSPNIPSSLVSPAPSPDELVIAQRGRRRFPLTWSPDVEAAKGGGGGGGAPPSHHYPRLSSPRKERTPVKTPGSLPLRSSPRKRLLLSDALDTPSPEKRKYPSPGVGCARGSPGAKRPRTDAPCAPFTGSVSLALRVYPKEQLLDIFQGLISAHPHLEEYLLESLPSPDLRYLRDKLHELQRNIFKSLPSSRLTSKTDSPAYSRASLHLLAFKKEVLEQGRLLVSSQQWEYVVEYALLAWEAVAGTPVWDNPPHNAPRRGCFKFLASSLISAALRSSPHWDQEKLELLAEKLKGCVSDSEEIIPCLKLVESMVKKK